LIFFWCKKIKRWVPNDLLKYATRTTHILGFRFIFLHLLRMYNKMYTQKEKHRNIIGQLHWTMDNTMARSLKLTNLLNCFVKVTKLVKFNHSLQIFIFYIWFDLIQIIKIDFLSWIPIYYINLIPKGPSGHWKTNWKFAHQAPHFSIGLKIIKRKMKPWKDCFRVVCHAVN